MSAPNTFAKPGAAVSLRDFARRRPVVERCELCSKEIGAIHDHLFEPVRRNLVCSCEGCALLFTAQADTKFRQVPKLARYLPGFQLADAQWNGLLIPIEMAFFFYSTPLERMVAFYPSPAGATESLLALDTWDEVVASNSILKQMRPDVEALLVNRVGASHGVAAEYYIVPIDECYKLVGVIRLHWHGLSGGTEMWREIGKFFAELKQKASVPREAANA
jgi:hypothetical protein